MHKIVILGANGNIARFVSAALADLGEFEVIKTSRHASAGVTALDALDGAAVTEFLQAQGGAQIDAVYANLGVHGQQVIAAQNVVKAMQVTGIKRLYWVTTAGIYGEFSAATREKWIDVLGDPNDPTTYFGEQAVSAKLIADSDLDYTLIRPSALTDDAGNQAIYEQTDHELILGGPISRKTVAQWLVGALQEPTTFSRTSVALSTK